MPEVEVVTAEQTYSFSEEELVTLGRRTDNLVVIPDPTVSRGHAVIRFEAGQWVLEDLSNGRTFGEDGLPVSRLVLTQETRLHLASPSGPWIRVIVPPAGDDLTVEARSSAVTAAAPGTSAPATPARMAELEPEPARRAGLLPSGLPARPMGSPAHRLGSGPRPGVAATLDTAELKRALGILIPVRSWIKNAGWRQGIRALCLVYAMVPLIFEVAFFNTTNFQTLGWIYALYTAPLWLLAFWYLIKPEDSPRLLLVTGVVIVAIVLLVMADPLQWYYRSIPDPTKSPGNWFGWLIAPGFAEEATKDGATLIGVLAAMSYFKKRLGVRSTMFLGTVAGLAFGVREAALYQAKDLGVFAGGVAHGLVQYVLLFSMRIFVDGLQHAEWAGIACFFFGLGLNYGRRRLQLIGLGFALGAVLHATNDWSTSQGNWAWLLVQIVSAILFLGYTLFAPEIEAEVKDTSLFRGQSLIVERARQEEGRAAGQT